MNPQKTPPRKSKIGTASLSDLVTPSEIFLINPPENVIITTEDKVHLCLVDHLKYMERKKGWYTPLGILLPLIAALITANFKDIGLNSSVWQAIFIISIALSGIWLIISFSQSLHSEKIEDIIAQLKIHSEKMIKTVKK